MKGPGTALQCAALGAFGGFFERGFRGHDYALGRCNCQKFLSDSSVLPASNIVMKAALDELDPLEIVPAGLIEPATCHRIAQYLQREH